MLDILRAIVNGLYIYLFTNQEVFLRNFAKGINFPSLQYRKSNVLSSSIRKKEIIKKNTVEVNANLYDDISPG